MIRLDDNIRMTAAEQGTLSTLVGFAVNPKTVSEHNALLETAQETFHVDNTEADEESLAEAKLMTAVLSKLMLCN